MQIKKLLFGSLIIALASAGSAFSQSSPNFSYGQVPTAGQLNSFFANKQDRLTYSPLNQAGGTMGGRLQTAPSTINSSGFAILPGSAPTSPANGDVWATPAGIFFRVNGQSINIGTIGTLGTAATLNVGTGAGTVAAGDDTRIANAFQRRSANLTVAVPGTAATPQAGVDACGILALDRTVSCTVSIAAGAYNLSSQITARSPFGDRISVQGAATTTTAISAVSAVSGSTKAYSVTFTVGSSAGIVVGSYVGVTGTTGVTTAEVHSGAWKVTAASGTSVTVLNTASNGAPPTGAVTGTLTVYPTQLLFTGASGFVAASLGGLSNLAIIGDGTTNTAFGLWAKSPDATQPGAVMAGPFIVAGFVDNVRANYGGVIHGTSIVSSTAINNGALARDGGYLGCYGCTFSGNGMSPPAGGGNGVLIENTSSSYLTGPRAWGNPGAGLFSRTASALLVDSGAPGTAGRNLNGWQSSYSAFLQAIGSIGSYNASAGWRVEANASMIASSASAANNGVNGYWALDGGFLSVQSATATSNSANGYSAITRGRIDAVGSSSTGNGGSSYVTDTLGFISSPNGPLHSDYLGAAVTPASGTAACNPGQIQYDTAYIYVCVSLNTWKRSALSAF